MTVTPEARCASRRCCGFPIRRLKAPLPAPPDGPGPGVRRPPAKADIFARDQALALAKSEAVASLRRARRNPRLFLSELAAAARDRPVVLSYAAVGDDFTCAASRSEKGRRWISSAGSRGASAGSPSS